MPSISRKFSALLAVAAIPLTLALPGASRSARADLPPEPASGTVFAPPPAASSTDPAVLAARAIARRVASFKNFRAEIPLAVWTVDENARFSIRSTKACLAELARNHVSARLVERELKTPVAIPVVLDKAIEGVWFRSLQPDREVEVSCELAVRLPELARILRAHGVLSVAVNSSYREEPKVSFHSFGLALDIAAFHTKQGTLSVSRHFEATPDVPTCESQPVSEQGRALLSIACAIAQSHVVSSVLTPNYNEGHRDHFHVDIRPDDPRLFVR